MQFQRRYEGGFTLIEFALVLIVLGLLAGSVVLEKHLVFVGKVRAQVDQIAQLNAAVVNFENKYNCLPGDCTNAIKYGLGMNGDGDGKLDGMLADDEHRLNQPEMIEFWHHLNKAGLIDGAYNGYKAGMQAVPGVDTPPLQLSGHGQYGYQTYGNDGFNANGGILAVPLDIASESAWLFHNNTPCNPPSCYIPASGPPMKHIPQHAWYITSGSNYSEKAGVYTAPELYAIESKMDDGLPKTGKMISMVWGVKYFSKDSAFWKQGGLHDVCLDDSVTPAVYNLDSATPKPDSLCTAAILAPF